VDQSIEELGLFFEDAPMVDAMSNVPHVVITAPLILVLNWLAIDNGHRVTSNSLSPLADCEKHCVMTIVFLQNRR
jgi:hypothetical protein